MAVSTHKKVFLPPRDNDPDIPMSMSDLDDYGAYSIQHKAYSISHIAYRISGETSRSNGLECIVMHAVGLS